MIPLLKKIIASKTFKRNCLNIYFEGNQLTGNLTIIAGERAEFLNYMFPQSGYSNSYKYGKPTIVTLATKDLPYGADVIGTDMYDNFDVTKLGYTSNVEEYLIGKDKRRVMTEEISTVFTIIVNNVVAGFFNINLLLETETGQATLNLHLNKIYVEPEFRGSTYWMDLTISIILFAGGILNELAKKLKKPHYLDVYVHADFDSTAGEKIGIMIERELRLIYEELPELLYDKPAFIGQVHAEMGY